MPQFIIAVAFVVGLLYVCERLAEWRERRDKRLVAASERRISTLLRADDNLDGNWQHLTVAAEAAHADDCPACELLGEPCHDQLRAWGYVLCGNTWVPRCPDTLPEAWDYLR